MVQTPGVRGRFTGYKGGGSRAGKPGSGKALALSVKTTFEHHLPVRLGVESGMGTVDDVYRRGHLIPTLSQQSQRVLELICAAPQGIHADVLAAQVGLAPQVLGDVLQSLVHAGAVHCRGGVWGWGGR